MERRSNPNQLPRLMPRGKSALISFDLTRGLPITWNVLRRHLGLLRTMRCLAILLWTSIYKRPLKHVVPVSEFNARNESLSQHQFSQVLLLHGALGHDGRLSSQDIISILEEVVGASGEAFISHNVPLPTEEQWSLAEPAQRQTFAEDAVGRFFNARINDLETTESSMKFTVTHCRFHQLSQQTVPELGPLFCAADSRFCSRPDTPNLVRPTTLASGGACCSFEFAWNRDEASSS